MKRFASLTALLLTLVLVLSLAACGDKNTADDNQTTDQPSTTQPADNGDAAQTNGATTGSVDLAALRDQLIADCGYTDTLPVETAGLESTYGITADQVTSSASFNAASLLLRPNRRASWSRPPTPLPPRTWRPS